MVNFVLPVIILLNKVSIMPDNKQFKRRTVFIKKAFQGRFIVSVLLMIMLFGLCSAGMIYWLISSDLQSQSQAAHVNIASTWERLGLSILIGNAVAIFLAGIPTIFVVLYISHKIAGPLYRFEKICEQVGNGNFDAVTPLREHDQLQDLALSFSLMTKKLQDQQQSRQRSYTHLERQFEVLKNIQNLNQIQMDTISALECSVQQLKKMDISKGLMKADN